MRIFLFTMLFSISAFAQINKEGVEAINSSLKAHPQIVSKHFKSIQSLEIRKVDEPIVDGLRSIAQLGMPGMSWLTGGWVKNNFKESIIDVKLVDIAGKTISFSGCTLKEYKGEFTNIICDGKEFKKYTSDGKIYVSILPDEIEHNESVSVNDDDRTGAKAVKGVAGNAAGLMGASQK